MLVRNDMQRKITRAENTLIITYYISPLNSGPQALYITTMMVTVIPRKTMTFDGLRLAYFYSSESAMLNNFIINHMSGT